MAASNPSSGAETGAEEALSRVLEMAKEHAAELNKAHENTQRQMMTMHMHSLGTMQQSAAESQHNSMLQPVLGAALQQGQVR